MIKETTSNFYDFSQRKHLDWILQGIFLPNVKFYYDKAQKAYCRKIINVKGFIRNGYFCPKGNFLANVLNIVNYKQKINV